ncbi:MAG: hypothetical protein Q9180_004157 [Flavoplaca navasiana]
MNPSTSSTSNCDSNRSASFTTEPNLTAQNRDSIGTRAIISKQALSELLSEGSQMEVKPPCESSHSLDEDPTMSETRSDEAERPSLQKRSPRTSIRDMNRYMMGDEAERQLSAADKLKKQFTIPQILAKKRKELEDRRALLKASVAPSHDSSDVKDKAEPLEQSNAMGIEPSPKIALSQRPPATNLDSMCSMPLPTETFADKVSTDRRMVRSGDYLQRLLETNTTSKFWALSKAEIDQIWLGVSRKVVSLLRACKSQHRAINQRNNVIESLNEEIEQLRSNLPQAASDIDKEQHRLLQRELRTLQIHNQRLEGVNQGWEKLNVCLEKENEAYAQRIQGLVKANEEFRQKIEDLEK